MNKGVWKHQFAYKVVAILIVMALAIVFQFNKVQAADLNTDEENLSKQNIAKENVTEQESSKFNNDEEQLQKSEINNVENVELEKPQRSVINEKVEQNDSKSKAIVQKAPAETTTQTTSNDKNQTIPSRETTIKNVKPASKSIHIKQPQSQSKATTNNKKVASQTVKNKKVTAISKSKQVKTSKLVAKSSKNNKSKASSKYSKAKKPQALSHSVKSKNTKHHKVTKKASKTKKATSKSKAKTSKKSKSSKKTKSSSKSKKSKVAKSKTKKPQTLATATKSKSSKKVTKTTSSKKKTTSTKSTKKKTTKTSYYNKPPKAWAFKFPGSDTVRDFGQTTNASGVNDALKIMKASGNKGLSIEHTNPKAANLAMIYNWNPISQALTYGTGTAIGKHTILTANHVVNDQEAHKPMTPSKTENLRVSLQQEGSEIVNTLNVIGVKMMQFGDVALVYTKEDLSKYMKIRPIASEKSISNIKKNTPIHMYHYGKPSGKYKNDPLGTMYHSKGKYSLKARNVNPIGYYQMMAEPGSSGGAILNSKNEVLGVHAFRIDSGDYKKYHMNSMAELRGKLRQEVLTYIM